MSTLRPHTVDSNYPMQSPQFTNRAVLSLTAGVTLLVAGAVMNNRNAGPVKMTGNIGSPAPLLTPVFSDISSDNTESTNDPLVLPFSKLSGTGKPEDDPVYLEFLRTEPQDVRTLTDGQDLEINGPAIWLTIPVENEFKKIPLSYAQTPEGKQVLKVGPNYFAVRYLKIGFPGNNMVFEAEVSKAEKRTDGIANTGQKTIPILGTFTDTSVMPFDMLLQNVQALTGNTITAGEILSVHVVGPRIFYFKLAGDTPLDIAMTPEEKVEIKRIYNDTIKEHDNPDTR